MTLSVNSAASALAALQALQTSATPSNTAAQATATSNPTVTTGAPAASVSASLSAPSGLFSVVDGIGQALSAADAGVAAGQTVLGLLNQMRGAASDAADPTTGDDARQALHKSFQASAGAIGDVLASAQVNGTNLVDGSMQTSLAVPLGDGATASLTPQDLSLGGPLLALPADASVTTQGAAASTVASLGQAIGAASQAVTSLQTQGDQISAHGSFVQAFGQALASPGTSDADSARLLALQVSQQLSASGGAISGSSSVLALFRS